MFCSSPDNDMCGFWSNGALCDLHLTPSLPYSVTGPS